MKEDMRGEISRADKWYNAYCIERDEVAKLEKRIQELESRLPVQKGLVALDECIHCKGTGQLKHGNMPGLIGSVNCPFCNGMGIGEKEFETKEVKCGHCGGNVKVFVKDFCSTFGGQKALSVEEIKDLWIKSKGDINVFAQALTGEGQ